MRIMDYWTNENEKRLLDTDTGKLVTYPPTPEGNSPTCPNCYNRNAMLFGPITNRKGTLETEVCRDCGYVVFIHLQGGRRVKLTASSARQFKIRQEGGGYNVGFEIPEVG